MRTLLGTLTLCAAWIAGADAGLPPEECVRMLREARIELMRDDPESALATLWKAVDRFPDELAPVIALAEYRGARGLSERDEARYRSLVRRKMLDPGTSFHPTSAMLAEDGDSDLTRRAVEQRLESDPDDPSMLDALAVLQLRTGEAEAARATLSRLYDVRPEDAVMWRLIELDRRLDRFDRALGVLGPAVARHPDDPSLRLIHLDTLWRAGHFDELVQSAPDAARDASASLGVTAILIDAGWALRDLGRPGDAEAVFRTVLEIDPEHDEARRVVLELYATEEERAAWREEEARRDADPERLLAEGEARLSAGDAEDAFDLLLRAAEALSDSEPAWFSLALAALETERWDEAIRAARRSQELDPSRAEAFVIHAGALSELDRCGEAVPLLDHAVALRAEIKQAHYYLWVCYMKAGEWERAAAARRAFESIDD